MSRRDPRMKRMMETSAIPVAVPAAVSTAVSSAVSTAVAATSATTVSSLISSSTGTLPMPAVQSPSLLSPSAAVSPQSTSAMVSDVRSVSSPAAAVSSPVKGVVAQQDGKSLTTAGPGTVLCCKCRLPHCVLLLTFL